MKFLPWYNAKLISFLEAFLKEDFVVFEYGGGASTLFYASKVRKVCTIETRLLWLNFVLENLALNMQNGGELLSDNIEIRLCENGNLPNFAKEIANFSEKKFDIIVVDSRDRSKCIQESVNHLNDGGIIILDNSERENLRLAKDFMKSSGFKEEIFSGKRMDGAESTSSVFYLD